LLTNPTVEGTPVLPRKQLPNSSDKPDKKKKKEKQAKVKQAPKEKRKGELSYNMAAINDWRL
jgi:hypothetical protein